MTPVNPISCGRLKRMRETRTREQVRHAPRRQVLLRRATVGGLDQLVHLSAPDGRHASLRRLLCDLIEEFGRHTGHADLLRETVDGLVGEDPPEDWHIPDGSAYAGRDGVSVNPA